MVFKYLTFLIDDDFLNTRPGSPPAFSSSPSVASPRACSGCIGVINRFDELQLRGRLEGGGAVEEAPEESPRERNAKKQVKEVSLLGKAADFLDAIGGSMTNLNNSSSFMLRSTIKEKIISVLAFEVANTIIRGADLMQSLAEQNIVYWKEEVLPSESVQYLVSTDMDELLRIAAAEYRKNLQLFTKEVVRLGNQCKDPQFYQLDRYFDMMESRPASGTPLRKDTWAVMLQLMNLVQRTAKSPPVIKMKNHTFKFYMKITSPYLPRFVSMHLEISTDMELYHELSALDRFEQDYGHKLQEVISLDAKDKNQSLSILRSELRSQRRLVKSLKKKSLWSRALEEVVEKLVDIILCLQLEVLKAFGSPDCERAAGSSAGNSRKLGSSGLALHYANIIVQIDSIVAHSGSVTPTMTNTLYQILPPGIESALRYRLREVQIHGEPTVTDVKAAMEKTLSWLAPVAVNTIKAHYGFARLGEWANMRSGVNQTPSGKGDFIKINTLYHADKEKADLYIVELLFWLHQLVCKRRAMSYGVTCSLDSITRGTSETMESETENPYPCNYHLPCTGICDSLTDRSLGVSVPILKTLSMYLGIDMMTALNVIDGITIP